MDKQNQLRNLYHVFFESAPISDLPNLKERKKATNEFYDFIKKVRENPALLGEDDTELNTYLAPYLDEYAFSAFGIGLALGKAIESEITSFTDFIKTSPKE